MPIISAVGLFCCNKFEETPNKKVSDQSKLTETYFNLTANSFLKSGVNSRLFHPFRIQGQSAEQKIGIIYLPTLPDNFWHIMME